SGDCTQYTRDYGPAPGGNARARDWQSTCADGRRLSAPGTAGGSRPEELQIGQHQPRGAIAQTHRKRALLELLRQNPLTLLSRNQLTDLGGERGIVHLQIVLEIQAKAAHVPVGAAHQAP